MPVVTVENAQIKTAAVEIKTLTISGRQVTLSVFRQIQEEDIFDENLALKGVPWGTVNYFWKEDYTKDKIHLLWQIGKELRRCILLRKPYWRDHNRVSEHDYVPVIKNNLDVYFKTLWDIFIAEMPSKDVNQTSNDCLMNVQFLRRVLDGHKDGKYHYYNKEELRNEETVKMFLENAIDILSRNKKILERETIKKDAMIKKYSEIIETFVSLPHLFIAV